MSPLTVVVTALLAAFASAQSFSSLPICAQNCTLNAIPSSCNLDPKCICSNASFIKAITCCVAGKCDQADQDATIKFADSICVPAGVTNLPTAAVCANSTSTANSTSSSTRSAAMSASSLSTMSTTMSASGALSAASSVASSSVTSAAAVASSTGDAGRAFYAQGLGMMGAAVGAAVALM